MAAADQTPFVVDRPRSVENAEHHENRHIYPETLADHLDKGPRIPDPAPTV